MSSNSYSRRILFILVSLYIIFIAVFLLNYSLPNYLGGIHVCFKSQPLLNEYKIQNKIDAAKHSIFVITDENDFIKMSNNLNHFQMRGVNIQVILDQKNHISDQVVNFSHYSKINIKGSSSPDIHHMIIIDSQYVISSNPYKNKADGIPFNNDDISTYILNGNKIVKPYMHYFNNEWTQSSFLIDNHLSFHDKLASFSRNIFTYFVTPQAGFLLLAFVILSIVSAALIQAYSLNQEIQMNGLLRVIVLLQKLYIVLFILFGTILFFIGIS